MYSEFFIPSGLITVGPDDPSVSSNSTNNNVSLKTGYVLNRLYNTRNQRYMYTVVCPNDARGQTSLASGIYQNCDVVDSFGSVSNYIDAKLQSADISTSNLSELSNDEIAKQCAYVLLLCVNGSSQSPVIIGTLRHPGRNGNGLGQEDLYKFSLNGVETVLKSDGSLSMTLKGPTSYKGQPTNDQAVPTTISISPEGKTVVSTGANQTITISTDGVNIQTDKKVTVDASEVNLNGASEAAVKGTSYVQAEAKFLTELAAQMQLLASAITAAAAAPTPTPLAPGAAAATAIVTAATTFQSSLQSTLSDSVKVG